MSDKRSVFKYDIAAACTFDGGVIHMPALSVILSVQQQRDSIVLWALVNVRNPEVERRFCIYGTGQDIAEYPNVNHVGTVQQLGGDLVWHVFEVFK